MKLNFNKIIFVAFLLVSLTGCVDGDYNSSYQIEKAIEKAGAETVLEEKYLVFSI